MPSVSRAQQGFMGSAFRRAQQGAPRSTDPKMPISKLREFAATPKSGLPARAPKYGDSPIRRDT
jgi:hypothetical protein